MKSFEVLFSKKAERDFRGLSTAEQKQLRTELQILQENPLPSKKKIKRLQGMKHPLYRLRADLKTQPYRIFYTIVKPKRVIVVRIIAKKDADRILRTFR